MTRSALNHGVLFGLRGKTGTEIAVPVGERLRAALDVAPPHDAVTASTKGRFWTRDGLAPAFQRHTPTLVETVKIDLSLTMKGPRHTLATVLREESTDERSSRTRWAENDLNGRQPLAIVGLSCEESGDHRKAGQGERNAP